MAAFSTRPFSCTTSRSRDLCADVLALLRGLSLAAGQFQCLVVHRPLPRIRHRLGLAGILWKDSPGAALTGWAPEPYDRLGDGDGRWFPLGGATAEWVRRMDPCPIRIRTSGGDGGGQGGVTGKFRDRR